MATPVAADVIQAYEDWATGDGPNAPVIGNAIALALLASAGGSGGGSGGDTPATTAFYAETQTQLDDLLAAVVAPVLVGNFPAFPAVQEVSGAVEVSNFPETQPVSGTINLGTIGGAATDLTAQAVRDATHEVRDNLGALTEAAPGTDTASSGLNGRLQRIAQRLGEILGSLPASLGQKTGTASLAVVVASDQILPISDNAGSLTVDAPVATPLFARLSDGAVAVNLPAILGAITETAPATDTASSGLGGRLQRVAQRLSSLIGLLPDSLGQKASAASLAVVVASDQTALPVSAIYAAPVTSTQTLTGIGLSASVAAAGKASFGVQLLWTGASTPQVVRLAGSFDGGSTWHLLGNTLGGEAFTVQDISDFAAAGLQPGLRWRTTVPELTNVRLRWVSGTATNLAIMWGVA